MRAKTNLIQFIIIIFSIIPVHLSGQGFLITQVKVLEVRNATSKTYSEIEGSPYYTDKFVNSTVYLKDGNYASIPVRYDIYQDQMEFMKNDAILWITRKDVKYVRYGNEMIFVSSPDGDSTKLGYFFLRDDGKILLFYKKSVIHEPMVPPKGYSESVHERFVPWKDLIYIKIGDAPAKKIVTRKDLTSAFAGNSAALEYIKANRIKPDNIEDIHKLVSFLNSK